MKQDFNYALMIDADFRNRLEILQNKYFFEIEGTSAKTTNRYIEYKNERLLLEKKYTNQEKRLNSCIVRIVCKINKLINKLYNKMGVK